MRKLSKLKKLSLINTENVKMINFDNLPRNLEALNFIACGLAGLRESIQSSFLKPYKNIVHLCLAMNKLRSELTDEYLRIEYFPNLARFDFFFNKLNQKKFSLDLADNRLADQRSLISKISEIPTMRSLNIDANPLQLYKDSSFYPLAALDLEYFNDIAVSGLINKKILMKSYFK